MRRIFITVIATLVLGITPPRTAQSKSADNNAEKSREHQSTSQNPSPLPSIPKNGSNEHQNKIQQIKTPNKEHLVEISPSPFIIESKKDGWDKALIVLTGALVFVAGIQILFLWGTVEATKANANAIIRSERAWLLMEKFNGLVLVPVSANGQQSTCCGLTLKNYGKTPAKMTAFRAELQIGTSKERPADESIYIGQRKDIAPSIIPQEGDAPQIAYFSDTTRALTIQEVDDIQRARSKFLWLCILVRYEDVFREKPVHETKLCYLFNPDGPAEEFRLAGPGEYNRAT